MKISETDIEDNLNYRELISNLKLAFANKDFEVPARMHLNLPSDNISLVMPAWNKQYYGLKQIIACPENTAKGLPTIQGKYDLFDVKNGSHLASINAQKLTAIRTVATSVLASSFFVKDPRKLVIMGTGVIGKHLEAAYSEYYELESVVEWNRSNKDNIDIRKEMLSADIVSCATHAFHPIIKGEWITKNIHIDLIGSYKKDMREADDELISKCEIYIDDEPALQESGDLYIPLSEGTITLESIKGNLFQLCKKEIEIKDKRLTLFKSVGHGIEDLAAAIYLYELLK